MNKRFIVRASGPACVVQDVVSGNIIAIFTHLDGYENVLSVAQSYADKVNLELSKKLSKKSS